MWESMWGNNVGERVGSNVGKRVGGNVGDWAAWEAGGECGRHVRDSVGGMWIV